MSSRRAVAALALFVTACAAPAPRPVDDPLRAWDARRKALAALAEFSAQGRVAAAGKGSAHLLWQQHGENFSLKLNGPFGAGAVLVDGTVEHVTVEDGDGRYDTDDPEATLAEMLGWKLPVRSLRWWALGLPSPAPIHGLTLDPAGRADLLVQDGWTVRYQEYMPAGDFELPRRYTLENDAAKVRVVVDQWTTGVSPP